MPDFPNMTSPREVIFYLEQYGLKPSRGMGQNFLIDGNTVKKIIAIAGIEHESAVVEVGPGLGALTVAMALHKARIVALELDYGLTRLLQDLLSVFPTVKVVQGDALKIDWTYLVKEYFGDGSPVILISNLPYNISSPFLYGLFKQNFPFSGAVLMFQKEVAERIVARPGSGNYGALSVLSQYYTEGKIDFIVSRRVFWPRPGVDSAVVKLERRHRALSAGEEVYFWKIVQGVFQQRRKNLVNGLLNLFPWPREIATDILCRAGVEPSSRPETLAVAEFANLTRIIYNYLRINE